MEKIDLICEVLDDQLVDRERQPLGKVDGIVAVLRKGKPPRVAYIETGATVLARRLHPRLGRWAQALGRRWGLNKGEPFRIAWKKVRYTGIDVVVDLDAGQTPALAWEKWLAEKIIGRIPGAG